MYWATNLVADYVVGSHTHAPIPDIRVAILLVTRAGREECGNAARRGSQ